MPLLHQSPEPELTKKGLAHKLCYYDKFVENASRLTFFFTKTIHGISNSTGFQIS